MMSKMTTHDTFDKQSKILHSQAREIIANVLTFMKNEAEQFTKTIANYKRVMAATGISEKMYKTIVKEAKDVNTGASTSFLSPRKQRPRKKTHELVEGEKHAAFGEVKHENWAAICSHVKKIKQDYKEKEPVLDDTLDQFIITVNTGSSDEEDGAEDEDDVDKKKYHYKTQYN
ncbi:hypothetical protein BDFB_011000, partial [Asbolus verrucosus]